MSQLADFLDKLVSWLNIALGYIASLPGLITSAFVAFFGSLAGIYHTIEQNFLKVDELCGRFDSALDSFINYIEQYQCFLVSNIGFAFDVEGLLGVVFTTFCSTILSAIVIFLFVLGILAFVILNLVGFKLIIRLLSVMSAGLAKL